MNACAYFCGKGVNRDASLGAATYPWNHRPLAGLLSTAHPICHPIVSLPPDVGFLDISPARRKAYAPSMIDVPFRPHRKHSPLAGGGGRRPRGWRMGCAVAFPWPGTAVLWPASNPASRTHPQPFEMQREIRGAAPNAGPQCQSQAQPGLVLGHHQTQGAGEVDLLPPVRHSRYGLAEQVRAERQRVLKAAYAAHHERFVHGRLTPPTLPEAVWINPPRAQNNGSDAADDSKEAVA